jgi:hypothetical protein
MKVLGEVWAGPASAIANEEELTRSVQTCRLEEEKEVRKGAKMGTYVGSGDQLSAIGRMRVAKRRPLVIHQPEAAICLCRQTAA